MYLIFLVIVLGDWVARIPMGALVAVMFAVSFGTFDWSSLKSMRRLPFSDTLVMVVTVATVVWTSDLALGVLVGIVLSCLLFARKVAKLVEVTPTLDRDGERTYVVTGALFFVSVETFINAFDFDEKVSRVEIDLSHAHDWDASAVDAIDRVVKRFQKRGVEVGLNGANEASASLIEQVSEQARPGVALGAEASAAGAR